MKKIVLVILSLVMAASVSAQSVFSEDFESVTTSSNGY